MIALVITVVASLVLVSMVVKVRPPSRSLPITLVSSDWEPYLSPDLPENGPLAQITTQTLQGAGYQPEYTFTSWTLAQQAVENGGALGVVAMVQSGQRDGRFLYSDPIVELRYTLFGLSDDDLAAISERDDLGGLRVARIDGYDYWAELDSSGAEFSTYPTAEVAFAALEDGEVDLVAEDALAGRAALDGPGYARDGASITEVQPITPLTSSTQGLHMLIRDSAEGRRLQEDFNTSLAAYRETSEYTDQLLSLEQTSAAVTLQGGTAGIELFDDDDPGLRLGVTPPGTHGTVLGWPEAPDDEEARVQVKLLDGPWQGKIVSVRLGDVVIADA